MIHTTVKLKTKSRLSLLLGILIFLILGGVAGHFHNKEVRASIRDRLETSLNSNATSILEILDAHKRNVAYLLEQRDS